MGRLLAGSTVLSLLLVPALMAWADPGDLDPTFGSSGVVTTDVAGEAERVSALEIDEDGKIVATGWISWTNDFFVARYNSDGSLDATFSGDGIVIDSFAANFHEPSGVAIDSNGSIVVVGRTGANLFMARYLSDGTLDATFSDDGHSVGGIAPTVQASSVAVDSQDRIVIGLSATGDDFFTGDEGSVFEADINRVAAAGVARGCDPPANDAFCPDQLVTRGQMAAFLVRGFFTD